MGPKGIAAIGAALFMAGMASRAQAAVLLEPDAPGVQVSAAPAASVPVVGYAADAWSGLPEPAGWALSIMGFGAVGAMLRRQARA